MTNKIEAENGSLLDLLKGKLSTNFLTTLDEKDMIFFMTFGFNEFKQLNSAAARTHILQQLYVYICIFLQFASSSGP